MAGMVKWKERALRAQRALVRTRSAIEGAVPHARHDGEVVIAGGLAGALRGAFEASGRTYGIPGPGGNVIPPELPIGLALEALAFSRQTPVSADLHAGGSGVLAFLAGRQAEEWMRTRDVAPKKTVDTTGEEA